MPKVVVCIDIAHDDGVIVTEKNADTNGGQEDMCQTGYDGDG